MDWEKAMQMNWSSPAASELLILHRSHFCNLTSLLRIPSMPFDRAWIIFPSQMSQIDIPLC